MRPGRKPETPSTKEARGTLKPYRDSGKVEICVPGDPPVMPDYLTAGAIDVWQEVLPRVMAAGVSEVDSAMLARYCSTEAIVRETFRADGAPPPAAYLTMLRQYEELLRIAGPKSRVGGGGGDGAKPANRFARNGSRNRA